MSRAVVTLLHYPNCSTCRRARKWLEAHEIDVRLVDLVKSPPSEAELARLLERSGLPLRKLFNTSGQSYRNGGFKEKLKTMTQPEALAALAADGKLIKRPILDGTDVVLVGFSEDAYASSL